MSCGTGKTYTSLKIAEKLFPRGKILFLVPSISLLNQSLNECSTFAEMPLDSICVCSDETASQKKDDYSEKILIWLFRQLPPLKKLLAA